MSIRDDILQELDSLAGQGGTGGWAAASTQRNGESVHVRIDLSLIEQLGCQLESVTVSAASLASASTQDLKDWSQRLAQRLTYLLESIGPLEVDEEAGKLLMRSTQPQKLADGCEYYELMLSATGSDSVSLHRYRSTKGVPGRDSVDMTLTREVVGRLAGDLIDTMP